MASGIALGDVNTLGRIFGQIKTLTKDPAINALADQGIQTQSSASAEVKTTNDNIAKANARADKAENDRNSAMQGRAWFLALLGVIILAGSIAVAKLSVDWGKVVGGIGAVLTLGGTVLALVVPAAVTILEWFMGGVAGVIFVSFVIMLVKAHGSIFELWQRNQLSAESTKYTASTASAIKSIVGDVVPQLTREVKTA